MKVSIAISTYEAGGKGVELLEHNLRQIEKQDYQNIEIVVSDHSQNDEIKNLVTQFTKYPVLYVRNEEHRGNSSQNTNNAMRFCTGDLIKVMFIDDYFYDNSAVSLIVSMFKNHKNKWLVNSYLHTNDRKNYSRPLHPKWNDRIKNGVNTIGCPSGLTIRKEVTERFDEKLKWLMDVDYYYRLYQNHGPPMYLHKFLVVNLLHPQQVTNTQIDKQLIQREENYLKQKYNDQQFKIIS